MTPSSSTLDIQWLLENCKSCIVEISMTMIRHVFGCFFPSSCSFMMCRAAVRSFLHYVTCIFVLLPDPLPSQHFAIEPFNPCMATPILKPPRIRVYAQTFWSGDKAPQWVEPSIRGSVFPICCFFTFASKHWIILK